MADEPTWVAFPGPQVRPLYTAHDLQGLAFVNSMPGAEPFVRGTQVSMYTGRPWTIRQYAGFSTAEQSNEFYRQILAGGGQGISVAFDLPTHRGYDSDNPRARGDVGCAGVAIDTVEDMKILFNAIALQKVSVSMTMSGAVLPVLAAYIVAAEEQGVAAADIRGTIQNDILKEFIVRNTYIYPPTPSLRIAGDVIAWCTRNAPAFNPISISGYHMQEAGAHPALELALTLANGVEYVKTARATGLAVEEFAGRLSFFWGVGMSFYQEIAKLRAARLLWSQIMRRLGAVNPRSLMLRAHCQTSGWSLTAQDPHNNIVRTTVEAMAAVFGGTQSLHTNAFDEALALPSANSARTARNTQLILQEETDLAAVVDPWAGSFMMERLTQDMADAASGIMAEVDALGGMCAAVESGWAKRQIEMSAARKQARIDAGVDVLVGVNKYVADAEPVVQTRRIDNRATLETQLQRLQDVRSSRDERSVSRALQALTTAAAGGGDSLLALSIQAMRARATVGEVSSALEQVWGRYRAESQIVTGIYAEGFAGSADWQKIRSEILQFEAREGRRPRLLMAKLGQDGHDRGYNVVASAFADLGFHVDIGPLFQTPEECARLAIENDVHAIGISSLAAGHATLVPATLNSLQAQGATNIGVFVGGIVPEQDHAMLRAAGVLGIFGPGTPILDCAREVLLQIARHASGAR